MKLSIQETLEIRSKTIPSGCRIWLGPRSDRGYGNISVKGQTRRVHRVAWILVNGEIPDRMYIDHTCHNRACFELSHLRLVTNKQNCENRRGPEQRSKSGIRGVSWHKHDKRWQVKIDHNGKQIYIGAFTEIEDAKAAAIAARNKYFTHNDLDRNPGQKPTPHYVATKPSNCTPRTVAS